MDEKKFFSGLCFSCSISAVAILSCRDEGEVRRLSRGCPPDAANWLVSFAQRFRDNARRLRFDATQNLNSLREARRVLADYAASNSGSHSDPVVRDVYATIDAAVRLDEYVIGQSVPEDASNISRALSDLKAEIGTLNHSVEEVKNRLRVGSTARQEEINGSALTYQPLIELMDYVLSLQLDWSEAVGIEVHPTVLKLVPDTPDPERTHILRLIIERFLAILASLDIELIELTVDQTLADPRQHTVLEVRDVPLHRPDLAGTISSIVRYGFRIKDRVLRQPHVIAYKKGMRGR